MILPQDNGTQGSGVQVKAEAQPLLEQGLCMR